MIRTKKYCVRKLSVVNMPPQFSRQKIKYTYKQEYVGGHQ